MPIIFSNWKIEKEGLNISLSAWVPQSEHLRLKTSRVIANLHNGRSSYGAGVQGRKLQFFGYNIPLNGLKIKDSKSTGPNSWTFSYGGETILILFSSRAQNAKYGIQSLSEILSYFEEINSGVPVVLPASSSEIVDLLVNASFIKRESLVVNQPPPVNVTTVEGSSAVEYVSV